MPRPRHLFGWILAMALIAGLATAVGLVRSSATWQAHVRKCEVIRQINEHTGWVRVDRSGPDWVRPIGACYQNDDRSTVPIGIFDRIVEIRLIDAGVDDDFLRQTAMCEELEVLNVSQCPITDQGLKHLIGLKRLEDLDLAYTKISDDGLAPLAELESLTRLDLSHNRLSGRGFHLLEPLDRLETICLVSTPLRDGALARLARLPSLGTCNVFGCRHLSRRNIEAFQAARPDCRLFGVASIEPFWDEE